MKREMLTKKKENESEITILYLEIESSAYEYV